MNENICHFVPYHKDYHSLHTINFVLETKKQAFTSLAVRTLYIAHYVREGTGLLHTVGKVQPIKKGDVFFTFPDTAFCIESGENLQYMYISFLGVRGNMLMERIGISGRNFYFENADEIGDVWERGIEQNSEFMDVVSESVLLYTFAYIGKKALINKAPNRHNNSFAVIKKYIDDNITNSELSLKSISDALSYNEKYISGMFKKKMGIGITEYVSSTRIQQACTMMEQGFTSISDISTACGFNDPLYFSKVFKKKMGYSPKEHIKK